MQYIRTHFALTPPEEWACELLSAFAAEEGYEGFEYTATGMTGYIDAAQHSSEADERIAAVMHEAGVEIATTSEPLPDTNWNATWEETGFPPIVIDGQCIVVDERHQPDPDVTAAFPLCVSIRATQAFGTATHATTQMMLRTLLQQHTDGATVVDCGTGTGLLAIVAAKQGAQRIVAYDIDKWSVDSAAHNAEANGVHLDIRHGDISIVSDMMGTADIVLANINRNVLLGDMAAFAALLKPDGVLQLSGFLADDVSHIVQAAADNGMRATDETHTDEWTAMTFCHDDNK